MYIYIYIHIRRYRNAHNFNKRTSMDGISTVCVGNTVSTRSAFTNLQHLFVFFFFFSFFSSSFIQRYSLHPFSYTPASVSIIRLSLNSTLHQVVLFFSLLFENYPGIHWKSAVHLCTCTASHEDGTRFTFGDIFVE